MDNNFDNGQNDGFYNIDGKNIIKDDAYNSWRNDPAYRYEPPQIPKKRHSTGAVVLSVILAAVIGAAGAFGGMYLYFKNNLQRENGSNTYSNVNINVDEEVGSVVEAVAKKASGSVVGIRTTTSVISFFGGSQESSGEGSGVVYRKDGYIITNYHVIESAVESSNSKIEVFIGSANEKSYSATVVGYHISSDLAVLKINASNLPAVEFADSDQLNVGQYAITIGSPGGLDFMGSVTYGVISGLNRIVSTSQSVPLIQTDAAINPGNSGGALLDTTGRLIGINSSKIVSEDVEGMGFAIPSNVVKERCERIISKKNVKEGYIGVSISKKYTSEVLSYYGYPTGAVVASVDENSPAEKAGIRRGDIITEFNGKKISEYNILLELVEEAEPKKTVKMKVYRNGNIYSVDITVGSTSN